MHLVRREPPRLLSLVIPCFNEIDVLPILRSELKRVVPLFGVPTEIVLVDDGSRDDTLGFLSRWAAEERNVKVIALARNFGHQNAATAGLDAAGGEAVVLLDADLQDNLEVILRMLERYIEGYDVVYGKRTSRAAEGLFKRVTAWLFYRLMRLFVHPELPSDTGDFRLISRRCLDAVCSMREVHRFLRGMVTWVGFKQIAIPYDRSPRAAGTTKYSLKKMLQFAWNATVSFSPLPLRISLIGGLVVAGGGMSYGMYAIFRSVFYQDTVPGWTTQILLTSLLAGAILISNGLLGEYISRIYEESKGRPLYIIAQRLNFPHGDNE